MKKITNKEYKEFLIRFELEMLGFGAKLIEDDERKIVFDLEVNRVGSYKITVYKDNEGSVLFSFYGRFDNVEKAKEIYNCNPYSGKLNFYFHNTTIEDVINGIMSEYECLFGYRNKQCYS
jgi:hypothetical protein